jgi:hypothetical protein
MDQLATRSAVLGRERLTLCGTGTRNSDVDSVTAARA